MTTRTQPTATQRRHALRLCRSAEHLLRGERPARFSAELDGVCLFVNRVDPATYHAWVSDRSNATTLGRDVSGLTVLGIAAAPVLAVSNLRMRLAAGRAVERSADSERGRSAAQWDLHDAADAADMERGLPPIGEEVSP